MFKSSLLMIIWKTLILEGNKTKPELERWLDGTPLLQQRIDIKFPATTCCLKTL
ncbi:rCG29868 [Rattus norvegicus]|uniref:RCG29868 n=1 Tax=Rattus norvegicus TaxID=10116 RepID=A6IKZ9_RAT|nr:rCG29868 [Rattus norvegicus]